MQSLAAAHQCSILKDWYRGQISMIDTEQEKKLVGLGATASLNRAQIPLRQHPILELKKVQVV